VRIPTASRPFFLFRWQPTPPLGPLRVCLFPKLYFPQSRCYQWFRFNIRTFFPFASCCSSRSRCSPPRGGDHTRSRFSRNFPGFTAAISFFRQFPVFGPERWADHVVFWIYEWQSRSTREWMRGAPTCLCVSITTNIVTAFLARQQHSPFLCSPFNIYSRPDF